MKSSKKIVFVGGIHGVGKSTICSQLCADVKLEYLSASKLINDYKNRLSLKPADNDKYVKDISGNQDILVQAIKTSTTADRFYLLDGHFSLLDFAGNINVVPLTAFSEIKPQALIVLIDDPASIRSRLIGRDGKEYSINLLESMQNQELSHARWIGKELNIKFYDVSVNDSGCLKKIITNTIARC